MSTVTMKPKEIFYTKGKKQNTIDIYSGQTSSDGEVFADERIGTYNCQTDELSIKKLQDYPIIDRDKLLKIANRLWGYGV